MRLVALLAMCVAACSTARAPTAEPPTPTADLETLYRARQDSAAMRFTPADVDFITGMIAHHRQAIVMSEWAPTHDASPEIALLAARIINAQNDEIAAMEQWLRDRGQPVPAGDAATHGGRAHQHMPGMLSAEQLERLDAARGRGFDRLFLQYMIQHHRGAVTMVHALFATDGAAQEDVIFKLASDIQVDQITEIARMELMLQEMNPS